MRPWILLTPPDSVCQQPDVGLVFYLTYQHIQEMLEALASQKEDRFRSDGYVEIAPGVWT